MLQAFHVRLGLFRQFFKRSAAGNVSSPAGEGFVNRFYLGQGIHVGSEIIQAGAVDAVAGADLDMIQAGEDIQKRDRQGGDAKRGGGTTRVHANAGRDDGGSVITQQRYQNSARGCGSGQ